MRSLFRAAAAASLLGFLSALAPARLRAAPPPNVVLILADDLGTLDLGCYGAPDLKTPNLDALARRGIRFSQFYVAAPVCSPSRAALLTGRQPFRAGVPGNVGLKPGAGLPPSEVTLAEALKPLGYATGIFGKWHLGWPPVDGPLEQGFDEFVGHLSGCVDNYSHYFYWSGPPFHDLRRGANGRVEEFHEDGIHIGEIIAREAERFIDAHKAGPFLLYLPFNMPHYPLQAPEPFRSQFAAIPAPRGPYAASVAAMDAWIGHILDHLNAQGLGDNTLVVFLSDHGHSTEERAGFGGGFAGPYRGEKFSLFEGGVRAPCIVSWPGRLPQGETRDQAATSLDLFPTIMEFARAGSDRSPPARTPEEGLAGENKLDGASLAEVLKSAVAPEPHASLYWRLDKQWAVRRGSMKLIANPQGEPPPAGAKGDFLYLVDLAKDPGERVNLAAERPADVEELLKLRRAADPPPGK